jgi:hypothetical protein
MRTTTTARACGLVGARDKIEADDAMLVFVAQRDGLPIQRADAVKFWGIVPPIALLTA